MGFTPNAGYPYPEDSEPIALGAQYIHALATALDVPWTNVTTFTNSWVNYNTGTFERARYRRIGDVVEVQGLIKSGTSGAAAFTLPVGYRPTVGVHRGSVCDTGHASVLVNFDGTVVPTGSTTWLSVVTRFSVL